jgi:epoxyqueuosine reductase
MSTATLRFQPGYTELPLKQRLVDLARDEGFELVRFAEALPLGGPRAAAMEALEEGRLAEMGWMDAGWLGRATDASAFLAGARTVVVLGLPCAGPPVEAGDGVARGRVARYAVGRDYHRVFETRLRRVCRRMRSELGAAARSTVDYGPLLERPWAAISGLGWIGKSTMVLAPGLGPWVLLGVIVTDMEIEPDPPLKKSCGACTRCISACPTGAISPDGRLDARLCISYHTIENRGPIPRELRSRFGDWVFGCDDCLTSCPVGRHATESHGDFAAKDVEAARPALEGLLSLDAAAFEERFRGRAIMRAKREGMARNACVALGNTCRARDLPILFGALRHDSALVRGHAAWAVGEATERLGAERATALAELRAQRGTETDLFALEELEAAIERLAGAPARS